MDRFLALHWNANSEKSEGAATRLSQRALGSSSDWVVLLDLPGLRVLSVRRGDREPAAVRLESGDGVVVGTLFEKGREDLGPVRNLPAATGDALTASGPFILLDRYWGNYVALWHSDKETLCALRDPCAALPCLMAHVDGVRVLASHAADIADLADTPFPIDWNSVQSFILSNYLAIDRTGLAGIVELLPGQCLRWHEGSSPDITLAWDAEDFCSDPLHLGNDRARPGLRDVVERCVSAWARVYREFAVRLSGGIDSTILLALLAKAAPERVLALHIVGEDHERHELALARIAAAHVRTKLVELKIPQAPDFRSLLTAPRLSRPSKQSLGMYAEDAVTEACDAHGIDCITVGHGGDALFLQRALTGHVARDCLALRGLGPSFFRTVASTAVLQEQSFWRVLGNSLEDTQRRSGAPVEPVDAGQRSLLDRGAIEALPDPYQASPLIASHAKMPPAKLQQMKSILSLRAYHAVRGHGDERDVVLPFFAQPIVEFCLRLPTYCFTERGVDRSLERSAFTDLIPAEVARRSGKGFINRKLIVAVEHNLSFLRDFLLDGLVMQQGWILRRTVEHALTPHYLLAGRDMEGVYNLIAAEAWARSWRR